MGEESFTVLELISQSPTTSVYKAHQNALGRTVLLKILHKHLLRDKELVARFSREAKACAMLHSENIVQVYDLTEIDGSLAIVMEYIEGHTLDDMLSTGIEGSEEFLRKVATSVLMALSYAHEHGVTHRDIKPSNILISEDGVVKVTDFGLASVSDTPSLTIEGSLIGTPAYMSPEQARGEVVDFRTDLFSLGVTLVEIVSGEKIFAGRSYTECIGKIQNFTLDRIDELANKCSPEFFEFLKKLLAPGRGDRYESARKALDDLGSNTHVLSTSMKATVRKGRKTPFLLAIGGAGLILIVALLIFSVLQKPIERTGLDSLGTTSSVQRTTSPDQIAMKSGKTGGAVSKSVNESQKGVMDSTPGSSAKEASSPMPLSGTRLTAAPVLNADSGFIAVSSTPWAHVYIDSEFAGTTPIGGSIEVPVGIHTVMFSNPVFAPIIRQVKVKPHRLSSVDGNFYRNSGYLFVNVIPWGKVYVDDQFRQTTPSDSPIVVSAGTRRLRIDNPHYSSIAKTLAVKRGDTLKLHFDFTKDEPK